LILCEGTGLSPAWGLDLFQRRPAREFRATETATRRLAVWPEHCKLLSTRTSAFNLCVVS
jgi:hypothetical protein